LEETYELGFMNAVDAFYFLFFAQLQAVFAPAPPVFTPMHAGKHIQPALQTFSSCTK
jgi:hypothetical protein